MDKRPIGVFDSGLGGLTTVKELMHALPNEDIVYFGDTGRVPYGSRGRDTLQKYARQDIRFLLSHDVKMVIAACGTVSSVLTSEMVGEVPVPFTGVLRPTAQAAVAASPSGRIGVIGTTATIRSKSYGRVIRSIRPEATVIGKACPLFVPLVEAGWIESDNEITRKIVEKYLLPLKSEEIDTLILGCTHYPLLYDMINDLFEGEVCLVDPGFETARYAAALITEKGIANEMSHQGQIRYYVSDACEDFAEIGSRFLGAPIGEQVEKVDIEQVYE